MSAVAAMEPGDAREEPVRYKDYLLALETLHAHRVNPAPPFSVMVMLAFSLHLALAVVFSLLSRPQEAPTERVLQLRLGGEGGDGAGLPAALEGAVDVSTVAPDAVTPSQAASLLEEALQPAPAPVQRAPSEAAIVVQKKTPPPEVAAAQPQRAPRSEAAAMARRGVRARHGVAGGNGTGAAGQPGGSIYGNSTAANAEIVARYEQELSSWLERHKIFPKSAVLAGIQGKVVVRVQMARNGKVLASRIEQSSGHPILDQAVLAQVKRADPFPPVPASHPGEGNLEYLFPVTLYIVE